jgi:hypothetical protein|nr:MAG TPA: hypothetical protein [Caudoviricetes sp.]
MKFNYLGEAACRSFLGIVCFILVLIVALFISFPGEIDASNIGANIQNWLNSDDDVREFFLVMFGFWVALTIIVNERLNRKYKEQEKEIEEREFRERVKNFMNNK